MFAMVARVLGLAVGVAMLVLAVVVFLDEWLTPPSQRRPW